MLLSTFSSAVAIMRKKSPNQRMWLFKYFL